MNFPIKITKIISSGGACPYQIEATTDDDQYFYLRYRGGKLKAGVAPTELDFWRSDDPYNVIDVSVGDPLDGSANHEEFSKLLKDKVVFPEGFKFQGFKRNNPE